MTYSPLRVNVPGLFESVEGPGDRLRMQADFENFNRQHGAFPPMGPSAFKTVRSPTPPLAAKEPSDLGKVEMLSELYRCTATVTKSAHDSEDNALNQEASQMASSLRATMLMSVRDIIEKYQLNVTPMDDLVELLGLHPQIVEWATRGSQHQNPIQKQTTLKFLNYLKKNNWDPLDFGFDPLDSDPEIQEILEEMKSKDPVYEVDEETGVTQPREGASTGTPRSSLRHPETKVLSSEEAETKFPEMHYEEGSYVRRNEPVGESNPQGAFGHSIEMATLHPNVKAWYPENEEEEEDKE